MNKITRLWKFQKGGALPLALILMGVGATLTIPVLSGVTSSLLVSRQIDSSTSCGLAANAGLEDAIWELTYNNMESNVIPNENDSTNYQLGDPVNGCTVDVTVTNKGTEVASDDFESNTWSGGTGAWASRWSPTGMTNVHSGEQPYQGSYHARIRGSDGSIKRSSDLTNQPDLRLTFWARAKNFEQDDEIELKVSSNGSVWTEAFEWECEEQPICDDTYYFYDIDLSPYTMSNQFWIWFEVDASNPGDKFFLDDVRIVRAPLFEVVVTADGSTTTALVIIDNGVASIYSLTHS